MARNQKAILLEKRAFKNEGPTAGKDGAHAADPTVEQIKQRDARANRQATQKVVLPAQGE
jgi:hypothetical protein